MPAYLPEDIRRDRPAADEDPCEIRTHMISHRVSLPFADKSRLYLIPQLPLIPPQRSFRKHIHLPEKNMLKCTGPPQFSPLHQHITTAGHIAESIRIVYRIPHSERPLDIKTRFVQAEELPHHPLHPTPERSRSCCGVPGRGTDNNRLSAYRYRLFDSYPLSARSLSLHL